MTTIESLMARQPNALIAYHIVPATCQFAIEACANIATNSATQTTLITRLTSKSNCTSIHIVYINISYLVGRY